MPGSGALLGRAHAGGQARHPEGGRPAAAAAARRHGGRCDAAHLRAACGRSPRLRASAAHAWLGAWSHAAVHLLAAGMGTVASASGTGGSGMGMVGYGGMGGLAGMAGMMPGAMADRTGKQPDWNCAECSNKNFGWRQQCNRCQASPRPRAHRTAGPSAPPQRGPGRAATRAS